MWIVFLSLMIIWFVICTVMVVRKVSADVKIANADTVYQIKCKKCGNEREASYEEVNKHKMTKTKSVKGSVTVAGATAGGTYVRSAAKKCLCTVCNKSTWHQIADYNQHAVANTKAVLPAILMYFASLFGGGIVLIIISKIVSFFAGLF